MKTENFLHLIREITGRPFEIGNEFGFPLGESELVAGQTYCVFRDLPLTARRVSFQWKAPTDEENFLRSFVTAFCSRYFEPNPAAYSDHQPGNRWENWDEKKRESASGHHRGFMFSKEDLRAQVEANFRADKMGKVLERHGFYFTDYGVGIFVLFGGKAVETACDSMREFLTGKGVGFTNELSKAGWVLRFRLGLTREIHAGLLTDFSNASTI
jgi:hypothetical protein